MQPITGMKIVAIVLFTGAFALSAQDGAALFKQKCAGCHGAQGEGKPAMKAPSLKASKMDANQIAAHLTKGEAASKAPHKKPIAGLTPDAAKAIAEYVKTLQ